MLYTGDDNGNYIEAGNGDDVLDGNGGNDLLFARRGNDLLRGGDGDDQLDAGEGDDVLVGGHGNDYLVGAGGADTYRFDAGDGSDRIDVSPWGYGNGPSRIVFGASVSAAEVVVSDRHDGNLLLSYGDSDSIVAPQALFGAHAPGTIEFADGTVWDSAAIHAKLLIGDDSDNVIEAYDGDNLLDGKGGNDRLTAFDGNDILRGGDGADLLSAGAGNNELVGGRGDDVLHGQGAVDIFRFEAGDGIDTIVPDYLVGAGSASRIVFGASVRPSDVVLSIDQTPWSEDLLLTYGSDAISVRSYAGIEQFVTTTIEFADGTVWNGQAIAALIGQPPASAMA